MASTTVIEISAELKDNTSSGVSSLEKSLNKIQSSVAGVSSSLKNLEGKSQQEIKVGLRDLATSGLRSVRESLHNTSCQISEENCSTKNIKLRVILDGLPKFYMNLWGDLT